MGHGMERSQGESPKVFEQSVPSEHGQCCSSVVTAGQLKTEPGRGDLRHTPSLIGRPVE